MQLRKVKLGEKYHSRSAGACDDTLPSIALEFVTLHFSFGGSYKAVRIERPNGEIDDVLPDYLTPWEDHLREERMFADRLNDLALAAKSLSKVLGATVELEDHYRESVFLKLSSKATDNLLAKIDAKPLPASCRINAMPEGDSKTTVRAKAAARVRRALGLGRGGRGPAYSLEGDQAVGLMLEDDELQLLSVRLGAAPEPSSALQDLLSA